MRTEAKQYSEINVVFIDPKMAKDQVQKALAFLHESHRMRPFTKPVAIKLASDGGYTISEGHIVTMTPQEIAKRFNQSLASGDGWALELNRQLCR